LYGQVDNESNKIYGIESLVDLLNKSIDINRTPPLPPPHELKSVKNKIIKKKIHFNITRGSVKKYTQ
jgi:hypothetical protein